MTEKKPVTGGGVAAYTVERTDDMTIGKKLAISAVVGIIGAAAALGSAQAGAKVATDVQASQDKAGCGNHDGGKCGSMNITEPRTSPGR